jgi:hypothetical protein
MNRFYFSPLSNTSAERFQFIQSVIQISNNKMNRKITTINLMFTWQLKKLAYFLVLYRR